MYLYRMRNENEFVFEVKKQVKVVKKKHIDNSESEFVSVKLRFQVLVLIF
jgi:hypothetical protein